MPVAPDVTGRDAELMLADDQVWQTACNLIETHGESAPLYALQCIDLATEVGNFARAARWRLVWQATRELTASETEKCLSRQ